MAAKLRSICGGAGKQSFRSYRAYDSSISGYRDRTSLVLWLYGPCGLRAAGEGKGNEKITDHDHTLSEKHYAVVSEHYGNFRSTYHGWNVCGGDCFFLSGNRHAGI